MSSAMAFDHIRYDVLAQAALRGVVRTVLVQAAKSGLPGDHHFYISFDTSASGVVLSKRYQTSDWARRPLSPPMLEYLRNDTRFLLDLRDRLGERLLAADLVEEADIEFRRLAGLRRPPPGDDPEAWRTDEDAEAHTPEVVGAGVIRGQSRKPYFEVLVVTPGERRSILASSRRSYSALSLSRICA